MDVTPLFPYLTSLGERLTVLTGGVTGGLIPGRLEATVTTTLARS